MGFYVTLTTEQTLSLEDKIDGPHKEMLYFNSKSLKTALKIIANTPELVFVSRADWWPVLFKP